MTRVSDKKLQTEVLKRIHRRFANSVAGIRTQAGARHYLEEILTEAEQLMLAKRLSTIYMLAEGISSYRISKTLGISVSTALRIQKNLDNGAYTHLVKEYRKKQNHEQCWKDIEKLLRLGMPPYAGKGRWKWLDELDEKYR